MNIYDIAKQSGVSIATVSRVLNGGEKVSPRTKAKVLAVMRREKYTPNAFARGLGLNTMRFVGILCTDVADIFYAKAVSLLESSLRKHGFDALLCCTGSEAEDKEKYLDLLLKKHVDAVIMIGSAFLGSDPAGIAARIGAAARRIPVVLINSMIEKPNVYCVLCDEQKAMNTNVRLLFQNGRRRILYLYDTLTYSGRQKLRGYREGCLSCGLPEKNQLIVKTEKRMEKARETTGALLRDKVQFDAVLASEDLIAVGAQKALADAGVSVPIIGFNDSILARCATPSLTSVDNMLESLCPAAVDLLMRVLEGKSVSGKILLSAHLVERETFRVRSQI